MVENRFLVKLQWIMEWRWGSVKFGAVRLCPMCHRAKIVGELFAKEER